MLKVKWIQGKGLKQLFGRLKSVFSSLQIETETYPLYYILYSIRRDMLSDSDLEFVTGQAPQTEWPILLSKEVPMPPEIPNEYTYMVSYWDAEKLLFRVVSKIQSEYVERKFLVSTDMSQLAP